ncbi:MAG TPA: PLP-dependent transferase [Gaiellaceae bacterium]|nr:PLP-dependent transferase [Gaiellaceae bacterium]
MRVDTVAVHAGREDFAALGVHAPPLDLSSTYPLGDLREAGETFDALAAGDAPGAAPIYCRLGNPTVARLEQAVAELEGTECAVAFASGMAALTAVLLALDAERRHVVALRPLYGGTDHLLAAGLLGTDVSWATAADVERHLRADTGLVLLETPANPTLAQVDIADVVARADGVPVLVDNTFATPVLQNPAAHGAALVLHSATKFIGGHGDVLAGVVATGDEWAHALRRVRIATGAVLHPLAAFLLHRGLPTLPLRVRAAQATARELARRLDAHPLVERVHYPGLPGGDPDGLLGRQLRGPGAVLAFEIGGGLEAAGAVMRSLRLVTPAVSLGATDTLIQHPAALTHRLVDAEARAEHGVSESLLRLSVGLEHVDDLWADLERGLRAAARAAPPLLALAG